MPISFLGRVTIVTGAGNGLGRGCALELARLGASVVVNDFGGEMDGTGGGPEAADRVADEIRAAGGTAIASYENIASAEAGAEVVHKAVSAFGRLDGLAHYAAIFRKGPFDTMSALDYELVVQNNLLGAFYVSQPAFQVMAQQGYGRVLFVGSAVGVVGVEHESNYGSSKGGLYGLSRCVALEGAPFGITANHLLPAARTRNSAEGPRSDEQTNRQRAGWGREYDPEHSAPFAAYLLSEQHTDTGQTYASMLGCFSKVMIAVTRGWQAQPKGEIPSIDDVAAHWDQIVDPTDHLLPASLMEWGLHLKKSYERA